MHAGSKATTQSLRIPRHEDALTRLIPKLSDVAGWSEYSQGDLEAALEVVAKVVYGNENDGRAWELMGLVFRDLAKPKSAVNAFENASWLVPLHPLSQICLAECYGVVGKRVLARDLYLSQVESAMSCAELLLLIAAGLEGIDEPHLAMEVCRKASSIAPDSGQVVYDMCFYASRCGSQISVIETLAWRAVELEPQNVHFRVGLSSLLIRLERYSKAHWIVSSLSDQQIHEITCVCCLQRIKQLYVAAADVVRSQLCEQRLLDLQAAGGAKSSISPVPSQTRKDAI